jgi:hypothetical protein
MSPRPTQPLSAAIEDQRLSLLNVLDIVHCISAGVEDDDKHPAPEISTAFELLEREIQCIAAALEKIALRSAMKARSGSGPKLPTLRKTMPRQCCCSSGTARPANMIVTNW